MFQGLQHYSLTLLNRNCVSVLLAKTMNGIRLFALAITLILYLFSHISSAQVNEDWSEEISGFTIDQTITTVGHQFTHYLASYRHAHPQDNSVNLTVYERPSARWGNLIWVTHEHQEVYKNFLHPNHRNLKDVAEQAAQVIFKNIKQAQLKSILQDTFDIEKTEL